MGGEAMANDASVTDFPAVERLIEDAIARFGSIDVLVCNHAYMTMAPFLDHDPDDWWRVVDTNLGGTFALVQAVLPGMRAKGEGRVVVVTSEWGVTGWPGATAYSASKAGLVSLVKTLGRELAPEGIIVNGLAPGVTDTPQLEVDARAAGVSLDEIRRTYADAIPAGRVGTAEEMADVVALLADFRLSALVGQVVQANGGSTRGRV
jgi:NAD(P)-dependent dehydrogenase (short-subunit alcohol dehydrogenase family)